QAVSISEQVASDDTGTFTITRGGDALTGGNTASVTVTVSGTATDGDFSGMSGVDLNEVVAAINAAATAANLTVSGVTATSLTITWDGTDGAAFNVNLQAFNDALKDSGETLTLTLSAPTVTEGDASLVGGQSAATLTILDNDASVTFAVQVNDEGVETLGQAVSISEQVAGDDVGTFTITRGGDALTGGNTASVTVTVSGTATDADFSGMSGVDLNEVVAAINAAATAANLTVSNVTATSLTITWDGTDAAAFNVNLTAFNDMLKDSGETLTLTLSAPTVTEGDASLVGGQSAATLTILDNDASVTFAVQVNDEGPELLGQAVSISEQVASDDVGTFTIT